MSVQKISFSITTISKLPVQSTKYEVADTKINGLRLAVYPSGVKTFFLYKKVNGQPQKIKIGRFSDLTMEQVTKEAKRLLALIALGQDPQGEKKAERLEM
jgi:hypothetical protein